MTKKKKKERRECTANGPAAESEIISGVCLDLGSSSQRTVRRYEEVGGSERDSVKDAGFCHDAETEWSKSPADLWGEM